MDEEYDFEAWEGEYVLIEEKRFEELIELRKKELKRDQNNIVAQIDLAEAYVLAKKYGDALDFLTPLYKKAEEREDFNHSIIKALKGLGKSIDKFDWIVQPKVMKLDEVFFKLILSILKKEKKNNRTVYDLYERLVIRNDYMEFNFLELEEWLRKHPKIRIIGDDQIEMI